MHRIEWMHGIVCSWYTPKSENNIVMRCNENRHIGATLTHSSKKVFRWRRKAESSNHLAVVSAPGFSRFICGQIRFRLQRGRTNVLLYHMRSDAFDLLMICAIGVCVCVSVWPTALYSERVRSNSERAWDGKAEDNRLIRWGYKSTMCYK